MAEPFDAKFFGQCGDCEELIHPGQPIVLAGGAGYVHEVCPTVVERKPAVVCPDCFIEKPCGCDD